MRSRYGHGEEGGRERRKGESDEKWIEDLGAHVDGWVGDLGNARMERRRRRRRRRDWRERKEKGDQGMGETWPKGR